MPQVLPLRALRYETATTGGLQPVVTPPYDVIDSRQRADFAARSPYSAVHVDLPVADDQGDAYAAAAATLEAWMSAGAVKRDEEPAVYGLEQDFTGPDGLVRTRRGFLARVRIEDYGPGRVRPHERTHPGPREDRLKLTRATRTNLSPIFALYDDPTASAWTALSLAPGREDVGRSQDTDGTVSRLWRVTDAAAIAAATSVASASELLIADGHHRYETARVYAEEIGGQGEHRYVLTCLVALQDPGLTIFPTHRLLTNLSTENQESLAAALRRDWTITELSSPAELTPPQPAGGPIELGYMDAHFQRPFRLTLRPEADLSAVPSSLRGLDTAITETLLLQQTLGLTEDDIDHLNGLAYSRSDQEAIGMIQSGAADAGFFMAPVPVRQVQEIAAAGVNMPPKSTFFFPKVPTGLLFNPLGAA